MFPGTDMQSGDSFVRQFMTDISEFHDLVEVYAGDMQPNDLLGNLRRHTIFGAIGEFDMQTGTERVPFPPEEYMVLVSGGGDNLINNFQTIGKRLVKMLEGEGMLLPNIHLLDVGCGCGRLTRYLTDHASIVYAGFDRHHGMIQWCKTNIEKRFPNFHFYHSGVKSVYDSLDQQIGNIEVDSFKFDFPEQPFDSVLLASVFTHMPFDEMVHYLRELHVVMRGGGKILLSVFFTDNEPRIVEKINFLHSADKFLDKAQVTGFTCVQLGKTAFGLNHNWFVLTRNLDESAQARF